MNTIKNALIETKTKKIMKNMNKKFKAVNALLEINAGKKQEELKEMIEKDEKASKEVKDRVLKNKEMCETQRLKFDEITRDKKEHHVESRNEFLKTKMQDFKLRSSKSQQLFFTKYNEVRLHDGEKAEDIKQKQFGKYEKQVRLI